MVEPLCKYCGYLHEADYSDVKVSHPWMEQVCKLAKERAYPTLPPEPLPNKYLEPMKPPPSVLHVKFKRIHGHADIPKQAYRHDAGWDLTICQPETLNPGMWMNLHTGVVAAIPEGYWGLILARSSTWRHRGIRVEPAVIDASYRGELMVYAVSTKRDAVQEIKMGDRLAQLIIVPLPNVEWVEQMDLPPGERGERGYGSSGT